jgi:hypothetical protein
VYERLIDRHILPGATNSLEVMQSRSKGMFPSRPVVVRVLPAADPGRRFEVEIEDNVVNSDGDGETGLEALSEVTVTVTVSVCNSGFAVCYSRCVRWFYTPSWPLLLPRRKLKQLPQQPKNRERDTPLKCRRPPPPASRNRQADDMPDDAKRCATCSKRLLSEQHTCVQCRRPMHGVPECGRQSGDNEMHRICVPCHSKDDQ